MTHPKPISLFILLIKAESVFVRQEVRESGTYLFHTTKVVWCSSLYFPFLLWSLSLISVWRRRLRTTPEKHPTPPEHCDFHFFDSMVLSEIALFFSCYWPKQTIIQYMKETRKPCSHLVITFVLGGHKWLVRQNAIYTFFCTYLSFFSF